MTQYTFSIAHPEQQYISINVEFDCSQETEIIQLPSWRPGRYELSNFAKNVKNFKVCNEQNQQIAFSKITKDSWQVACGNSKKIKVSYLYYASELNAGSTYLDKNQLYVNPVNCCVYLVGQEHESSKIHLQIPDHYEIACALPTDGRTMTAENFDQLADSPFICSPSLQYNEYTVKETKFKLWFQGEIKVDWDRILKDFDAFSKKQLEKFGIFPAEEYHFFFQIVPYKAYHGVEHLTSTVILLGPSYEVFGEFYKELLGVSSHELYHAWNVKSIRPIDMFPYDFTKENYSRMGYLCEGVTTYMGDLFLYKSGVFNFPQYVNELKAQLQKHFDNFGRFSYSVADSSFDTWLDGYVPGAPSRKVSIYTEGCLLAFATDVFIVKHSKGRYKLDDVMRFLYHDFYLHGKGVSEEDYKAVITKIAGESIESMFEEFYNGTASYESLLTKSFDYLGLEMTQTPSTTYSHGRLGFKSIPQAQNFIVKAIFPGSPAELGGMMLEDEIIAVNNYTCNGELEKWLQYFDLDAKRITVLRKGTLLELLLPEVDRKFYSVYDIQKIEKPIELQQNAFVFWSK